MSTLYIVATPIGNLDDFTTRAVDILRSVSCIACEDTRKSGILLNRYEIETKTFPFHQHNEHRKVEYLVQLLDANREVALISDAGMPGISDPGFLAIRAAYRSGHSVRVIPGPDAATTAIVASGLPCDRYIFEGFLPHKKGRRKRLEELGAEERTVILYESPHRLIRLLKELIEVAGRERWGAVCRELTKKFEETVRGRLFELLDDYESRSEIKGEFVIILAGKDYDE